jgi:uncharacterized protein with HEPN domain
VTGPESRDASYLEHMLEAIARIRSYVGRKRRTGFLGDTLLQDAVIRNIEIVGEAAGRVSPEFSARHADIPWREIVGMRHRLIHGYLKVNLETVWQAIERDLPALERRLAAVLGRTPVLPAAVRSRGKPRTTGSRPSRKRVRGKRRRR